MKKFKVTVASHDICQMRDMRDAGGALGPVDGINPQLHNLMCSMTFVEPGWYHSSTLPQFLRELILNRSDNSFLCSWIVIRRKRKYNKKTRFM